jgi:DNA repair ATPase RecN
MTDIVERLRATVLDRDNFPCMDSERRCTVGLAKEAADEIERLRAELVEERARYPETYIIEAEKQIERLRAALEAAREMAEKAEAEVERLRENHARCVKSNYYHVGEIERLRVRVSELVAALDKHHGTPCEQIRHRQEIERMRAVLEAAREMVIWWDKQSAWIQAEVHLAEHIRIIRAALAAEDDPFTEERFGER